MLGIHLTYYNSRVTILINEIVYSSYRSVKDATNERLLYITKTCAAKKAVFKAIESMYQNKIVAFEKTRYLLHNNP